MQVVKTQPTGAFTQGGAGIGAVIFDKPQYDPQTISLKVGEDLDKWGAQKQKEAEAKKNEFKKLVADLDFDTSGVLNNDRSKIKELSEQTIASLTKAYQTNDPLDWDAHQRAKAALENSIQASKMDADLLKIMSDPAKLSSVGNFDELMQNAARIRTMPIDSKDRDAARSAMVGAPKKKSLNEAIADATKDYNPSIVKDVKSDKGIIREVTQETKFTDEDLQPNNLPMKLYMSSKEVRDAANEMLANGQLLLQKDPTTLTPEEQTALSNYNYYVSEAANQTSSSGKYVSPQVLMAKDILQLQNYTKDEEVYKDETSTAKEMAKVGASKAQAKNAALGLIKFLSNVQSGNPDIYKPTTDQSTLGGWTGVFYGAKPFSNIQYGKYNEKETIDGVEKTVPKDNFIRYFNWDNGQLKIATDESILKYKDGKSPDPFFMVDNISELAPTISLPLVGEGKGSDMLTAWTEVVNDKGWGLGNTVNVDIEKVAPLTPQQKARRDAGVKGGVTTKPTREAEFDAATGQYKVKPTNQEPPQNTTEGVLGIELPKLETNVAKKKIGAIDYTIKNVGQEQLPLVTNEQEYNNLPKGTVYTSSDNKRYLKK